MTATRAGCRSRNSSARPVGRVVGAGARPSPRRDLYTWNVFAPRIGVVFDLAGDGKTVLKANYGLYWHNPGVGIGGNANPNTANKSRPTWTTLDATHQRRPALAAG